MSVKNDAGLDFEMGRLTCWILQPDLPRRLKDDIALAPSNPPYYGGGPEGYTDYPFATEAEVRK